MNTFALPKYLVIYGILIPVALVLGYVLSDPTALTSLGFLTLVVWVLCLPLLLRFHHPMLIFSWNFPMIIAFFGQPSLWMLMAGCSLAFSMLAYGLDKKHAFQNVPSITWSLLALGVVVLVTAKLTGGVGIRALGSSTYGGRKFVYILASIIGYFAMSWHRIQPEKANRYVGLYFLPGLASTLSNFIYLAGPAFWFLFYFFPIDTALDQAMEDFTPTYMEGKFSRLTGLTFSCMAGIWYLFARYGISGVFDLRKFWRFSLLLIFVALGMLGGFRSFLIIFGLVFVLQFFFERLYRTRLLLVFGLFAVLGGALILTFSTKLPLSVQRCLTFLPVIEVDPIAKAHAQGSIDWRLEIWNIMIPQIPKYLILGKGYALDPIDLYLMQQGLTRGFALGCDYAAMVGDYHNGPLSILIPLGLFGFITFLWFCFASIRWLYQKYRDGPEYLKVTNTFLLSCFLARVIFFFVGFGSLFSDLPMFVGLIALSVALNGTARESSPAFEPAKVEDTLEGKAAPALS